MNESDYRLMAAAINNAGQGAYTADPNPRVGCVIVKAGVLLGQGGHQWAGGPHAEIVALNQAGSAAQGSTAYVTLEPCCHQGKTPPCVNALIEARVVRVCIAMLDPNPLVAGKGVDCLQQAGITVEIGVLQDEAQKLNPGFIKRMEQNRPYVRSKIAMSLDGRTAMASGESQWITGVAARADGQAWRARSSVILTGIGTVLHDNPRLNVRDQPLAKDCKLPDRAVVDTELKMPPGAQMLSLPGKTMIFTTSEDGDKRQRLEQAGAVIIPMAGQVEGVDLDAVMAALARQEFNEVLVEAGAGLNGALLSAGLIDEFILYVAPHFMGNDAKGLFDLPGLQDMKDRFCIEIVDIRLVGVDWRIQCIPSCKQ